MKKCGKPSTLWEAVYHGDITLVQKFIEADRDSVNVPSGIWMNSPLHIAVKRDNLMVLRLLIECNANVNKINVNNAFI